MKTELGVKEFMESLMKQKNLEPSFPMIVASGKNASVPHYSPQNKKLAKGFCVVDFGIKYKGYCTDITRTFFIGKPTENEKKIYRLVFNAKQHAASLVKAGEKTAKITKKTRIFLGKYNQYFTHGLGHGIGMEIHELPNLKIGSYETFKLGMIFTIEPGIYINNKFGIRIEDDYLLSSKGIVQLTKAPKDLIIAN